MANVTVTITGDAASLRRALGDAGSQLDAFQAKAKQVGDQATSIGRSMTIGVTLPLVGLFKTAFDELSQSAAATAQTEAVIKSTGGAAHVTAGQVDELSSSLLKKTGIDDEIIKGGANVLLTFKNIKNEVGAGNDIFTQATKATLDLSVAFGKDMTSSAILVGKALQDPIQGVSALRRVGVQLSDAQVDQIKHFVELGDVMSAQKVILGELTSEVGGSAAAYGDTFAGQLSKAKEELKNAMAAILEVAIPVMQQLADWAVSAASAFQDLPGPVKEIAVVFAALVAAAGPATYVFGAVAKAVSGVIGIIQTASSVFQTLALKAMYAWDALKNMDKATILQYGAWAGFIAGAVAVGVAIDTYLGGSEGGLAKFAEGVKKAQDAGKNWGQTIVAGAKESAAPLDELRSRLETLRISQENVNKQYDAGKLSAAEAAAQHGRYAGAIDEVKGAIAGYKQSQDEARAADAARKSELDQVAAGTLSLANASDSARQAVTDLASAQLAAAGGALGLEQANLNVEKAQDAFNQAVQAYGPFSREAREAGLALQSAHLAVWAAADKATDSQDDFTRAVQQGPSAIDALIAKTRDEIAANGDATGALSERIYKLLEAKLAIEGIPTSHVTDVIVNGVYDGIAAANELKARIDALQDKTINITARFNAESGGVLAPGQGVYYPGG